MSSKIVVGIAAHKQYEMPTDEMYLPIQVGAAGKASIDDYQRDDEGDNISQKNPYYSELTATYWLWKNVQGADYKGLVHYRRHFSKLAKFSQFKQGRFGDVLDTSTLMHALEKANVVVPEPRNYRIETLYSHYEHSHNIRDLDTTVEIIRELTPEYADSFEKLLKGTSAHMFNMYIMKADLFDQYAEWMFRILFELEQRIDISGYDRQEARVYGYVSELMLDAWLDTNKIVPADLPVMFMEKQSWVKKGSSFIMRKLRGSSNTK